LKLHLQNRKASLRWLVSYVIMGEAPAFDW
jgi:hypothetical protein